MKLLEDFLVRREARKIKNKHKKRSKQQQTSSSPQAVYKEYNEELPPIKPSKKLGAIPKQKGDDVVKKSDVDEATIVTSNLTHIDEFDDNNNQGADESVSNNLINDESKNSIENEKSSPGSIPKVSSLEFESLKKKIEKKVNSQPLFMDETNVMDIDELNDSEYQFLKPLVQNEVAKLFQKYKVTVVKRKPNPSKERGVVFNRSLQSLLMRDVPPSNSMVPQIFQTIICHMSTNLRDKNLANATDQKFKIDDAIQEIDQKFYTDRFHCEHILFDLSIYELVAVFRKLIKELQDPILTMELYDMFYKTTMIPVKLDRIRALNYCVLLLPVEHRNTLREIILFYISLINNSNFNYMTLTNVAAIITKDFFDPRILNQRISLRPKRTKNSIELSSCMFSCCNIMETFLKIGENLWYVPKSMAEEARALYRATQHPKQKEKPNLPALPTEPCPKMNRRRRIRQKKPPPVPLPNIKEDDVLQIQK